MKRKTAKQLTDMRVAADICMTALSRLMESGEPTLVLKTGALIAEISVRVEQYERAAK